MYTLTSTSYSKFAPRTLNLLCFKFSNINPPHITCMHQCDLTEEVVKLFFLVFVLVMVVPHILEYSTFLVV